MYGEQYSLRSCGRWQQIGGGGGGGGGASERQILLSGGGVSGGADSVPVPSGADDLVLKP